MDAFIGFLIIALGFVVYFIPAIIAANRNHPNFGAISMLNLFLGWTLLGWVGALVWSVASTPTAPATATGPAPDSKTCPQCAESVKAAAKVCRFCGHQFAAQQTSSLERAAAKDAQRAAQFQKSPSAYLKSVREDSE